MFYPSGGVPVGAGGGVPMGNGVGLVNPPQKRVFFGPPPPPRIRLQVDIPLVDNGASRTALGNLPLQSFSGFLFGAASFVTCFAWSVLGSMSSVEHNVAKEAIRNLGNRSEAQ